MMDCQMIENLGKASWPLRICSSLPRGVHQTKNKIYYTLRDEQFRFIDESMTDDRKLCEASCP